MVSASSLELGLGESFRQFLEDASEHRLRSSGSLWCGHVQGGSYGCDTHTEIAPGRLGFERTSI